MTVPKALTIAGSDSGGGTGIQADLKTFSAFRVFGISVLSQGRCPVALAAQQRLYPREESGRPGASGSGVEP